MITKGKKWHDLAAKKLSRLFQGITWKHKGDRYCLSWLHSEQRASLNQMRKSEKILITIKIKIATWSMGENS